MSDVIRIKFVYPQWQSKTNYSTFDVSNYISQYLMSLTTRTNTFSVFNLKTLVMIKHTSSREADSRSVYQLIFFTVVDH